MRLKLWGLEWRRPSLRARSGVAPSTNICWRDKGSLQQLQGPRRKSPQWQQQKPENPSIRPSSSEKELFSRDCHRKRRSESFVLPQRRVERALQLRRVRQAAGPTIDLDFEPRERRQGERGVERELVDSSRE